MRAVRIHEYGDESKLRYDRVELPAVGPRHVQIRVGAASVNRVDLSWREGSYRRAKASSLPIIPGMDIAGVVEAVGSAVRPDEARVGDRVLALLQHGGYAECVVTHVAATQPVPSNLSLEEAAGIPVAFLTAWFSLLLPDYGGLQEGQSVLINAAGSGVGTAAIQIAKHVGARVIASAGSDWKLEQTKQLGADAVVNYTTQSLSDEVLQLTKGFGVDVVLESVGGDVYVQSLEALVNGGRLVNIGNSMLSGPPELDEGDLAGKAARLSTFGLESQIPGGGARRALAELLGIFREGRLRCIIDRTFPLKDAAAAHRYLAERKNFGKVILVP